MYARCIHCEIWAPYRRHRRHRKWRLRLGGTYTVWKLLILYAHTATNILYTRTLTCRLSVSSISGYYTYYYTWIAIIVLSTQRRLYDLCLPYVPDLAVSRDRVYLSTWYVPDRPSWKWICTTHIELYITRVSEIRRFYRQKTTG